MPKWLDIALSNLMVGGFAYLWGLVVGALVMGPEAQWTHHGFGAGFSLATIVAWSLYIKVKTT